MVRRRGYGIADQWPAASVVTPVTEDPAPNSLATERAVSDEKRSFGQGGCSGHVEADITDMATTSKEPTSLDVEELPHRDRLGLVTHEHEHARVNFIRPFEAGLEGAQSPTVHERGLVSSLAYAEPLRVVARLHSICVVRRAPGVDKMQLRTVDEGFILSILIYGCRSGIEIEV
jgi:hypothetical protein